jgi:hypothetical protein
VRAQPWRVLSKSAEGLRDRALRRHDDVDEQVTAVGCGRHLVDEQLSNGARSRPIGQGEIECPLNLSAQLLRLVFGVAAAGRVVRRPGECVRELRVYERRPSAAALMA